MRILITGCKGVIGKALQKALAHNHQVFGCDLSHGELQRTYALRGDIQKPNYYRCDVGNWREVSRIVSDIKPELVYHAAAEFGRWNGEDHYEKVWQTNAIGTKNILRLQELHDFKLVHFSSSEVYGDYADAMSENVLDKYPIHQLNDYALSKRVNEEQIKNSMLQYKTKTVIVRLFNTYGPGEFYSPYRSVNCRFIYCAIHELPVMVYRGHRRCSTYIEDAVAALARIATVFKNGAIYNIGSSANHKIEDIAKIIFRAANAEQSLISYNHSEPLTTKEKLIDNRKACEELGYKDSVGLTEGVQNTINWMRHIYGVL